ncbi:Protein kinase domain-containing protein [Balamuthia mandrillaris]
MEESRTRQERENQEALRRFVEEHGGDEEKAEILYRDHLRWEQKMNVKHLRINHVYQALSQDVIIPPIFVDKHGRAVFYFRAAKHDPSRPFLPTLMLIVYLIEIALKRSEEVMVVELLDGFTKAKTDPRLMKFLLEMLQLHYPGRVAAFIAIHAPWYYRLLWKLISPWVPSSLSSRVTITANADPLKALIDEDNLLEELGGNAKYDREEWVRQQCAQEGVDYDECVSSSCTSHEMDPSYRFVLSDPTCEEVEQESVKIGSLKKQGNVVRRFNSRWCALTPHTLFYFKARKDDRPEGWIMLEGSTVRNYNEKKEDNRFVVVTAFQKECVFMAGSAEEKEEWMDTIQQQLMDEEDSFAFAMEDTTKGTKKDNEKKKKKGEQQKVKETNENNAKKKKKRKNKEHKNKKENEDHPLQTTERACENSA